MSSGDKLQEAIVEATRQACPKCGHKRFLQVSTVYEDTRNLPLEEDGTFEWDSPDINYESGEYCETLYYACMECDTRLVLEDGEKVALDPQECFEGPASGLANALGCIIETVSKAQKEKAWLANTIKNLGKMGLENPDIKVLSDNYFTIKLSSMCTSASWSPEYYNFGAQFRALAQVIEQSSITAISKKLYDAIENGKVVVGHARGNVVKLHPEVVRILKHSLSGGRPE